MSEVFFFNDLMHDDGKPTPDIKAAISFLSTEEGGRKGWAKSGYKPNHNFGLPDGREFYVGEIYFDSEKIVYPGETCEATVRFIPGPGLREKLKPGQTWRIQEGGKLVAMGKVLEVIQSLK